jgi:hypothetical protein
MLAELLGTSIHTQIVAMANCTIHRIETPVCVIETEPVPRTQSLIADWSYFDAITERLSTLSVPATESRARFGHSPKIKALEAPVTH